MSRELWKGVGLHKKNMHCLQPVVSKLGATVGELEQELHRLTEQEREVVQRLKEKKESQEAMEARRSHTRLSPEVAKLSEALSKWDSSLQGLICYIKVSCGLTGCIVNKHNSLIPLSHSRFVSARLNMHVLFTICICSSSLSQTFP